MILTATDAAIMMLIVAIPIVISFLLLYGSGQVLLLLDLGASGL